MKTADLTNFSFYEWPSGRSCPVWQRSFSFWVNSLQELTVCFVLIVCLFLCVFRVI